MIIEDERDLSVPIEVNREMPQLGVELEENDDTRFQEFFTRYRKIRDIDTHIALRNALIDHLWEGYSNSNV